MTAQEIQDFLASKDIKPQDKIYLDWHYDLPTRDWFLKDYALSLRANLSSIGGRQYVPEKWDCDKFSLAAVVFAKIDQNVSTTREHAIAIGYFGYYKAVQNSLPVAHAIIFAIVENPDWQLVFIEPQAQFEAILSPDEMASCFQLII